MKCNNLFITKPVEIRINGQINHDEQLRFTGVLKQVIVNRDTFIVKATCFSSLIKTNDLSS